VVTRMDSGDTHVPSRGAVAREGCARAARAREVPAQDVLRWARGLSAFPSLQDAGRSGAVGGPGRDGTSPGPRAGHGTASSGAAGPASCFGSLAVALPDNAGAAAASGAARTGAAKPQGGVRPRAGLAKSEGATEGSPTAGKVGDGRPGATGEVDLLFDSFKTNPGKARLRSGCGSVARRCVLVHGGSGH